MGTTMTHATQQVHLRLDEGTYVKLRDAAMSNGRSSTDIVTALVAQCTPDSVRKALEVLDERIAQAKQQQQMR